MIKIEHDKNGRVIKKIDSSSGFIYRYKYDQNIRIVNISLQNKKSKIGTILKERESNSSYFLIEKKDLSNKYIITTLYDNLGREKRITRYNRTTRKKYIKENLMFKNNEPVLWVERYSKRQNFGFKISVVK